MYGIYDKGGVLEYFYWSVMSYRPESDIQLLRFEVSGGCLIYIKIILNIYIDYIKKMDNQTYLFLDSIEEKKKRGE